MAVQTAVADPTSIEGARIRGPWPERIDSFIAEGDHASGRLAKYGTDPLTQIVELPALPAADVDAIATAAVVVAAAAAQYIEATTLNGAIGRDRITPCRTVTLNFDASTDWDVATVGVDVTVYGHDARGAQIEDTVNFVTGSGASQLVTSQAFASVDRIWISAGSAATGGAMTIGVSNDKVELSPADYPGLTLYRAIREYNTAARNIAAHTPVDIMTQGRMMCVPEHAVSIGDEVYVRVLLAGADLRGQLTGMDGADTPATYAKLAGARWRTAAAADGFAIVEVGV